MGAAYEPDDAAGLMREVSFWVMLVAVFAYDLRQTLYLGRGLAVGLMFESMCMGQIAAQLFLHVDGGTWSRIAAVALLAVYLVGIARQLLVDRGDTDNRTPTKTQAAHGRSARYIADDLHLSFNTVRTHIRHVYEKLGIHFKQELIDLVDRAALP